MQIFKSLHRPKTKLLQQIGYIYPNVLPKQRKFYTGMPVAPVTFSMTVKFLSTVGGPLVSPMTVQLCFRQS